MISAGAATPAFRSRDRVPEEARHLPSRETENGGTARSPGLAVNRTCPHLRVRTLTRTRCQSRARFSRIRDESERTRPRRLPRRLSSLDITLLSLRTARARPAVPDNRHRQGRNENDVGRDAEGRRASLRILLHGHPRCRRWTPMGCCTNLLPSSSMPEGGVLASQKCQG